MLDSTLKDFNDAITDLQTVAENTNEFPHVLLNIITRLKTVKNQIEYKYVGHYYQEMKIDETKLNDQSYIEQKLGDIDEAMEVLGCTIQDRTDKSYKEGMRYYLTILNRLRKLYV